MDITSKAMLAKHTLKMWSARKRDEYINGIIADKYKSDSKWTAFNKRLIASETMQAIREAGGQARRHHYKHTLPWEDTGARILPASLYFEYMQVQQCYIQAFNKAVIAFGKSYEGHVADAAVSLGGLFQRDDYPDTDAVIRKFSLSVAINPIPDGHDFRVALTADEVKAIRKDIEERTAATLEAATFDLLERLSTAVTDVRERVSGQDPVFRNSLMDHLAEIVALIPNLNVTGNPKVDALCKRAAALIKKNDPQVLRENPNARGKLVSDADVIIKEMSAYAHVLGGAS